MTRHVFFVIVCLIVVGCSSNNESPGAQSTPAAQSSAPSGTVTIDVRSYPNPPKPGDTTVEAIVKGPDGKPITDATVAATLSMTGMPTMSNDARMTHQGEGTYRGLGKLSMAGTWNVTISVSRDGKEIGSQRFDLVVN